MKNFPFSIAILCLMILSLTGCVKNGAATDDNNSQTTAQEESIGDIDVDLTALSSTMVYAEVYNMMVSPDDYMGKTIKMSGPYYAMLYDKTGLYYHYVIIEDAMACCQSGLEFIWKGEHSYPNDYPEDQTIIEVVGVFERYEELGETYYYLAVDDILTLK